MRILCGLRVSLVLGSLFTILLKVIYWVDIRGFRLNTLQESCDHTSGCDREQEERKQRIIDVCSGKNAVEFPGRNWSLEQIPIRELDHLVVDDTHQIIYCFIPKVASTNWMRVMAVLSQSMISGNHYKKPEDVPPVLAHSASLHLTLSKFKERYGSLSSQMIRLHVQHYTKFLFVRDPFLRLISAFRDKFDRPNEVFYQSAGMAMLRHYGNVSGSLPEKASEAFAAGIKPTFQQFISYVLDPKIKKGLFDEHWRQMHRLCHPCQVKYDFIGHVETLDADADKLLKRLKLDRLFRLPSGQKNKTTSNSEKHWFAQVPVAMRRELYKVYEADFKLFGYPEPDSILY